MSIPPVLANALAALGEEDGAKVLAAINQFDIPAERISFALGELGHSVSASTIRSHRRYLRFAHAVSEAQNQ